MEEPRDITCVELDLWVCSVEREEVHEKVLRQV